MKRWALPGILLLAFLLRVIGLNKYPVGFTPDEASFGYDAYSILKTGKDQWGKPFPIVLESFGDFKSPLYAYLTIPSVAVFGLNKFAVRLPNAILGSLAVYVLYLLTNKLFAKKFGIWHYTPNFVVEFGILPAFLLAISPWHVMLSRGAFEANLTTLFLPLGIYLFLTKRFFWSGIILGLNLFSYHSAKLITPLVFVAFIIYSKEKLKNFYPALLSFALFLGLTFYTFTIGAGARISERSITSGALEAGAKIRIELIQKGMNPILARALHNKYQIVIERFIKNYIQYFSPRFLIFKGPAETTYGMMPGMGVLAWAEIMGIIALIFHLGGVHSAAVRGVANPRGVMLLLLAWLLIAPVPAALSTGVGYAANRVAGMVPVIQILAGIGLALSIEKYARARHLAGPLMIIGLGVFLYNYVAVSPQMSAKGMLVGNLENAGQITSKSDKYDSIVVPRSWSEPHIYIAFASEVDPKVYQEATKSWKYEEMGVNWVDQMPEYRLGKYIFK